MHVVLILQGLAFSLETEKSLERERERERRVIVLSWLLFTHRLGHQSVRMRPISLRLC
jgi:hypothetical protein